MNQYLYSLSLFDLYLQLSQYSKTNVDLINKILQTLECEAWVFIKNQIKTVAKALEIGWSTI